MEERGGWNEWHHKNQYFSLALCYISWLLAFLAQLNPLTGPQLEEGVAYHIREVWSASKSGYNQHCLNNEH